MAVTHPFMQEKVKKTLNIMQFLSKCPPGPTKSLLRYAGSILILGLLLWCGVLIPASSFLPVTHSLQPPSGMRRGLGGKKQGGKKSNYGLR